MQKIIQFVSNYPIIVIIWISLLLAVLYTTFVSLTSKIGVINYNEVTRLINKENAIVVDLRQREDFRKGHIVGAINLSSNDIKNDNITNKLDKYKSNPIIIVNYTGIQAQSSANILYKAGFNRVFILKEGISSWIRENMPLICDK